jgi:hypothetical protein
MKRHYKFVDMTGAVVGRLTVLSEAHTTKRGTFWNVRCECGTEKALLGTYMRGPNATLSCGCAHREMVSALFSKHGESQTRLYKIWTGMKKRCGYSADKRYPRYGGRGIRVCEEWSAFPPFAAWARANGYADTLTIERLDNDVGYMPTNCTWIPLAQQSLNRAYTGRAPDGRSWVSIARDNGITGGIYHARVRRGWGREEAATTPRHAPGTPYRPQAPRQRSHADGRFV